MKGGGRQNEDGSIDEQRCRQRHRGVDGGQANGIALIGVVPPDVTGLHDAGMEIEIVASRWRRESPSPHTASPGW